MSPDILNATFEFCGALMVAISIRKLIKDKMVRGISWFHVSYFATWGCFNVWYYAAIFQPYSWAAGALLAFMNMIYVVLLAYYQWAEKRCPQTVPDREGVSHEQKGMTPWHI